MSEFVQVCPTCGGSGLVEAVAPDDDQALADEDQTASDQDQTASDQDQTWSDHDQSASDRDQRSAVEDQEASDHELAAGSDPVVYNRTRLARERATEDRAAVARLRDETATGRMLTAEARDRLADERDRIADGLDRAARETTDMPGLTVDDALLHAQDVLARAAADRAHAAADRSRAAEDRKRAARERAEAVRAASQARHDLMAAGTDELTGVWSRRIGLANVTRELERATRNDESLILGFIDVDGLKEVNDTRGHAAGDGLLKLVADTLRAAIRPYDLIVRFGGDEFLCAMPNLTDEAARERLEHVAATLTVAHPRHSIAFGLAEHSPGEQLEQLISRADADLLETRRSRGR